MNIAVVGTGYVGLVTGTCLADTGNSVICIDIDKEKVQKMQSGEIPIYEPGLDIVFERNTKQGRLTFTTSLEDAIKEANIIFLALPTPPGENGNADLKYIIGVAEELSHLIKDYKVIVDKSTVPVGTAEQVHKVLAQHLDESLFDVVSNPEFLREGVAVDDFQKPDRIVVGTRSEKAKKIISRLYAPFLRTGNPIYFMDERSAEMTKYAANAYLATRISFMNEIANLCEKVGANVNSVRKGIGSDSRIGKRFLFPGAGFGGSCFPKDVLALNKTAHDHNYSFRILDAVLDVNAAQRELIADKIISNLGNLQGKTIAVWGLSFKPNTDDVREAPAIYTINKLIENGAKIKAFDPEAMDNISVIFGDKIELVADQYEALIEADALAIMTEWSVFRTPSFKTMKKIMNDPIIFDGRNLYALETMVEEGFQYHSIGRNPIKS
jgi:UDPglucose 6-dehydrogenase